MPLYCLPQGYLSFIHHIYLQVHILRCFLLVLSELLLLNFLLKLLMWNNPLHLCTIMNLDLQLLLILGLTTCLCRNSRSPFCFGSSPLECCECRLSSRMMNCYYC